MRRFSLAVAVALLAAGPVPLASPAHAATARQPVLFVHGYNSDGSTWDTMRQRFRSAGYADSELFAWSYDWRRSNTQTAQALATKVDGTGAAPAGTRSTSSATRWAD